MRCIDSFETVYAQQNHIKLTSRGFIFLSIVVILFDRYKQRLK